ncbi:hypothetical protein WICPIJ_001056 [Wickerhamomyces pijperi]|uniref:Flavin-containing monooxygenase n=1 Tax=Wickerhamomyces pijperi TaxID=599730 RepID=A0A9P8QEM8_WICPI|nr:hypothetical protein WICPIJ_001056 [Wickerhamomyces pijperi]
MTIDKQSDSQSRVRITSPIKSIAIIGGGASGAITLDTLKSLDKFDEIVLYERRDVLGGVWYLDEKPNELDIEPGLSQNELDPQLQIPKDINAQEGKKLERSTQERYIHTASYETLRTNIPEHLMTYSDEKSWGADQSVYVEEEYVRGTAIQEYIERYVQRNKQHVVFNTTVESIDKDYSNGVDAKFKLTLRTELSETNEDGKALDLWTEREFDSVIIATGHYHVPYIPDVPGLKDVYRLHPGKISHSKTFRITDDFKDQKLLIIGTRASGSDIAEIAVKTAKVVYQSKRSPGTAARWADVENLFIKPKIERYTVDPETKEITVHFNDGTTITDPDQIIYATGFRFSYPFLKNLYPGFTTGYAVPDLYLHTFFTKDPRLTLVGVPTDAISFRAFEFQAVLVSRYLAGLVSLPPLRDQITWGNQRYRLYGDTRAYHTIEHNGKLEYLQSLVDLGGGVEPIDDRKIGRPFPVWTDFDLKKMKEISEKLIKFFGVEVSDANGVTVPEK